MFSKDCFYSTRTGHPVKLLGHKQGTVDILTWLAYYQTKTGYKEDYILTDLNGISVQQNLLTNEMVWGKMKVIRLPKNEKDQGRIKELLLFLNKNDMTEVKIKLTNGMVQRLETQAERRNKSLSELIEVALSESVYRYENQGTPKFFKLAKVEEKKEVKQPETTIAKPEVILRKVQNNTPRLDLTGKLAKVLEDKFHKNVGTKGLIGLILKSEFAKGGVHHLVEFDDKSIRKYFTNEIEIL